MSNVFTYCSINVRNLKATWLFADSIRLYAFHDHNYTAFPVRTFRLMLMLEDQKNKIISQVAPAVDWVESQLPRYDQFSNPAYLQRQRQDNLLLRSELEFFLMGLPYSLLFFLLLNRLFFKIYQSPISRYLRIFSFGGFLLQMLIDPRFLVGASVSHDLSIEPLGEK